LHISAYSSRSNRYFETFLQDIVPAVRPRFVVCTGDITDAKNPINLRTYQHIEEWHFYQEALKRQGYYRPDFWLDIPGNHDRFDVLGSPKEFNSYVQLNSLNVTERTELFQSYHDYYKIYSVQKSETFLHTFPSKNGDIIVTALDGWYSTLFLCMFCTDDDFILVRTLVLDGPSISLAMRPPINLKRFMHGSLL
jgi:Calcineurin-like phosphoesterase